MVFGKRQGEDIARFVSIGDDTLLGDRQAVEVQSYGVADFSRRRDLDLNRDWRIQICSFQQPVFIG
jgi:hypothetical protein